MAIWTLVLAAACLMAATTPAAAESVEVDLKPGESLQGFVDDFKKMMKDQDVLLNNDQILSSGHALKGKFQEMNGSYCYVTGDESASIGTIFYSYSNAGFTVTNLIHADALAAEGPFLVVMPDVLEVKHMSDQILGPKGRSMFLKGLKGLATSFCKVARFESCFGIKETTTTAAPTTAAAPYPYPYPYQQYPPQAPPPAPAQYPPPAAAPAPAPVPAPVPAPAPAPETVPPPPPPTARRHRRAVEKEDAACLPIRGNREVLADLLKLGESLPTKGGKKAGIFGTKDGAVTAIEMVVLEPNLFEAGFIVDPTDEVPLYSSFGGCGVEFHMQVYWAVSEVNYPNVRPILMKTFDIVHEQIYAKAKPGFFGIKNTEATEDDRKAVADVITEAGNYFREKFQASN